jgi:hypothetical protein
MLDTQKLVKISDIVDNQIPDFIQDENPNFSEFLKQYYYSQEFQGGIANISENLFEYKNFSAFNSTNLISFTTLTSDIEFFDDTIQVESTKGWPNSYGLLKINDEIITYTGITTNSFTGCIRGFSGIESFEDPESSEFLVFKQTESNSHSSGDVVNNLSNLFLIEFFKKQKYLYTPGFEEVDFDQNINPQNFLSKARTFYQSKGTDEAYKILFKVLYGENVEVVKPREFCFTPSDDNWIVTETFVCSTISGDPLRLVGQTLYQDADQYNSDVLPASGSIYSVDTFALNNQVYYKLRIFSGASNNLNPKGSIFGTFVPTYKTHVTEDVISGSNTIFVDTTVGFPKSGLIYIGDFTYSYTDKTNNQFLNVSSLDQNVITENIARSSEVYSTNFVYSFADGDQNNIVSLRINNVISSIESNSTILSTEDDPILISNVGLPENNTFVKSLKFNLPISIYSGKAVDSINAGVRNFRKQGFSINTGLALTKYEHKLINGDTVNLFVKQQGTYQLYLSNLQVSTSLSKEFSTQRIEDQSILGKDILFRRNLVKTKAIPFTKLFNNINNKYTANIQDAYSDDNYNYITSNGLPDYEVNPYIKEFEFTASDENDFSLTGSHNFYTGESVTVVSYDITGDFTTPVGFNTGDTYYVYRVGPSKIRLSETRSNVGITSVNLLNVLNGSVIGKYDNVVLSSSPIYGNNFSTSKLFKKIPKTPRFEKEKVEITPGPVGIFVNGVEIQSYKSFDKIYYGKIEKVNILNSGRNYSLINPPRFRIFNNTNDEDLSTFIIPEMEGELVKFNIINAGYNYEDTPTVTVTGGSRKDVPTTVKMRSIFKEVEFNSTTRDTIVRTVDNTFQFGYQHGFVNGEPVVYVTNGTFPIGIGTNVSDGTLLDQSVYYISSVGSGTSFRLANTRNDSLLETNLINLRTTGGGVQNFRSLEKIQVIDDVSFVGIQSGFKYKKLSFAPENINIFDNTFSFENHGYVSGEEVVITVEGTFLGGATPNTKYYIDKLDDNTFRLCLDQGLTNILNINGLDFATTYFVQYPPIEVNIEGRFKQTTSSIVGYGATILPVVRGYVKSAHVQRGLSKPALNFLGEKDIVNYHKKPTMIVTEGYDAEFLPIIEDGKIIEVVVKNPGEDYFNDFELIVEGQGYGAQIAPVISNGQIYNGAISFGQIIDVDVVNGGVGYAASDTIIRVVNKGEDLRVSPELTTWTLNEVTKLGISNLSNGYLFGSKYSKFGNVFGTFFLDSNLLNSFGITPGVHSPIVGWSYDGVPIYGPYAYENTDGTGNIVRMRSGYTKNKISPPTILECIEDYVFTNSGDLDESNGRFAITPEYPEGIYAYYCTIDNSNNPVFPYVIGNTFNYIPEPENFDLDHNQELDFNDLGIIKYTNPYRVKDKENYYEYFGSPVSNSKFDAIVTSSSVGKINSIEVIDGGLGYEVGDRIDFDPETEDGIGAFGKVHEVLGVGVTQLSSETTTFNDVKFITTPTGIVGIATTAHGFKSQTFINISGITTAYSEIEGFRRINVEYPTTILEEAVPSAATSGIVTSLKLKSPISNYRTDDIVQIGSELLTVIGVDRLNNRLNVLRGDAASPGYAVSTVVSDFVTKFTFAYPNLEDTFTELDESYYFNPVESVSVGISTLPGVGNELTVKPLGYGVSITKYVEHGGIFLPFNNFRNGEEITYSYSGSSIVTNAGNLEDLPKIYIVKIQPDIIGIVQDVRDINNVNALLRFNSVGTGNLHRFRTKRDVVTGSISQINVNVSTASTHGLSVDDRIKVNVVSGITTTYTVGYSSITKRLLIDGQTNPEIKVYSNQEVVFDLTDPSISGKDFNLYEDNFYRNQYFGNEIEGIEVIKTPTELTLQITDSTPKLLYYNLKNITGSDLIYEDPTVPSNNSLKIQTSIYSLESEVVGVTSTTFTYNLPAVPENDQYLGSSSDLSYSVLNSGVKGPIHKVNLIYGGNIYKKLPQVTKITTTTGQGANLNPVTNSIGVPKNIRIVNNQSVFSSDKTLTPFSITYGLLKLKDNYRVSSLRITNTGRNYITAPILKLYNKAEDRIVTNFSAAVNLKSQSIESVDVINGAFNLKTTDNIIVSTNNSNGLKVLNATVSGSGPYEVSLRVETPISGFTTSNPLPIQIGDEIFVENIINIGGFGFNSSDHKYENFVVTFVNPNFDSPDSAIIRYELDKDPGAFSPSSFNASVSKYEDLLKVEAELEQTPFFNGEKLKGLDSFVLDNPKNDPILDSVKVTLLDGIKVGDIIQGESSKAKAEVVSIRSFTSDITLNSSSSEEIGWRKFRGNLSTILQKLQDNDYYQNFSYSLKSKKSFTDWQSIVNDVAHVSGYKQFGDLSVESELPVSIASTLTVKSDSSSLINVAVVSESDISKISNFDLVIEEDIDDNEGEYSEFIKFGTKKLSDFLLSRNNRVLPIDDISNLFDTDNSPFVLIPIDTVDTSNEIVLKYFFFVGATVSFFGDFERSESFDLFVTRNNADIYLTAYAYFYDFYTEGGIVNLPLGEIEATTSPTNGDEIVINFSPRNIFNSYAVRAIKDSAPVGVGIATTSFGYLTNVERTVSYASTSSPTAQVIYSYPLSDLTSGSGVIGVSSATRSVENAFEFSFIKDVNNVINYNIFAENNVGFGTDLKNLGTFGISTTASSVDFTFTPSPGIAVTVFSNLQINNTNNVSPNEVLNELSITNSEFINFTGSSQVAISTVSDIYCATKYLIEAEKTVGLTTQRSIFQINSVHFRDYNNQTIYGFTGDLTEDQFNFETIYSSGNYSLNFTPNESGSYKFKILRKSILSPNVD